jgi:hypothetical protein
MKACEKSLNEVDDTGYSFNDVYSEREIQVYRNGWKGALEEVYQVASHTKDISILIDWIMKELRE